MERDRDENDTNWMPDEFKFEVRVETDLKQVHKVMQKALQAYKDEKRGPTIVAVQSHDSLGKLQACIPILAEFPQTQIHIQVR